MNKAIKILLPALLIGLTLSSGALATAGCGSSKPAFCSDREQLEESIKGISQIDLGSDSRAALEDQLNKIETDARTTFQAAEEDFPTETREVETSLDELASSIEGLPESPDSKQLLPVLGNAANLLTAFGDFRQATDSACN